MLHGPPCAFVPGEGLAGQQAEADGAARMQVLSVANLTHPIPRCRLRASLGRIRPRLAWKRLGEDGGTPVGTAARKE